MLTYAQIKQFTLTQEKAQSRPWEVYSGSEIILQENGTNPRVVQLPAESANEFAGLTDKTKIYEVRIIKHSGITHLIKPARTWEIDFKSGNKIKMQVIQIKECTRPAIQDFAWTVILGY